jgi:hypothetical protein
VGVITLPLIPSHPRLRRIFDKGGEMDLAMNKFPLRLSPGLPIYAEDWPKVLDSWQMLLNLGAEMVYPSHGRAFSAEIIHAALSKEVNK